MSKKGGEDYVDEWEIVDKADLAKEQIKKVADALAAIQKDSKEVNVEAASNIIGAAHQLFNNGKTSSQAEVINFSKLAERIKSKSPIFGKIQEWAQDLVEFLNKQDTYEKDGDRLERMTEQAVKDIKTIAQVIAASVKQQSAPLQPRNPLTEQSPLTGMLDAGLTAGKPQLNDQSSIVEKQSPTQQQTFGGPPPPPPPPPPAQQTQGDITAAIRAAKEKNQSRQGESTAKKAVGGDMMSELANKLKKRTSGEIAKPNVNAKTQMTDLDRKNAEAIAKEEAERAARNKAILEKQAKEKEARAAKEEAAAKPKEQATPTQPSQPIINTGAGAPPPPPPPPPPGMGGISTPTWKQQQEAAKLQEQGQQPVTVKKPAQQSGGMPISSADISGALGGLKKRDAIKPINEKEGEKSTTLPANPFLAQKIAFGKGQGNPSGQGTPNL